MNHKKPLVKNAADVDQVRAAASKEKYLRDRELEDIRWVLSSKQGRRFYWRMLGACGLYKSSASGEQNIWFLEGQRNVGLKMNVDLMDANPNAYLQMLNESKEEA